MHPILLQFHGITFYSYGFAVAVAMIVSLILAERRAWRFGLEKNTVADLLFALFIFGVLGARAMFVWQHWDDYTGDRWGIFRIQEGGLVWYGGLFGAMLFGMIYALWRKWPVLKLCDFFAPIAALAHGIGRLGCFFNGCCYGKRTESFLGVHFPEDAYAKIPIQLYEALGLFIISAFLFSYSQKPRRPGNVLWVYLVLYAALRFFIEFFRGDNAHYLLFTLPQWMSLGLLAPALVLLTLQKNRQ